MTDTNPLVLIRTEEGDMTIRVFLDKAPISGSNFLRYVDGGFLDGQSVFRIVTLDNENPKRQHSIEALHWGWLPKDDKDPQPFPDIPHEPTTVTGLTHKYGSVSMARYAPGVSGPSFSIMMRDDPEMDFGGKRQPDGQGFCAFGQVESGFDTMAKLFARAEGEPWLKTRIPIHSAARIEG